MEGIKKDKDSFWETALRLRSQQMELIASNIANADTPNYKARDIDFKTALQQALAIQPSIKLTTTSPQHHSATSNPFAESLASYRVELQPSVDGNTVDMDVERSAFAQSSIMYEFTLQHAVGKYKDMIDLFKSLIG